MNRKPKPDLIDDENPEWTAEDFKRAVRSALPESLRNTLARRTLVREAPLRNGSPSPPPEVVGAVSRHRRWLADPHDAAHRTGSKPTHPPDPSSLAAMQAGVSPASGPQQFRVRAASTICP